MVTTIAEVAMSMAVGESQCGTGQVPRRCHRTHHTRDIIPLTQTMHVLPQIHFLYLHPVVGGYYLKIYYASTFTTANGALSPVNVQVYGFKKWDTKNRFDVTV